MRDVAGEFPDGLRDRLTGLPGLDALRARVEAWSDQASGEGPPAYVHAMLIALRRFDAVNRAYGAAAGDNALEEVAARLSHFAAGELDGQWLVARSGGGTFMLVSNEASSRERWQLIADQLAEAIARPIGVPDGILRLSPRIALIRRLVGEGIDSMIDRLGIALARTEGLPGRRMAWADGEETPPGRSSAEIETDLLAAIDRGEIEILFQPQFGLPDDRLIGAEALARWNHPELGRIGAGALFAIAERADYIAPLSRHIADVALGIAGRWPKALRLSLNITPADLAFASYVPHLLDTIRASGIAPRRVTLEVTEQALLHDVHLAARMMADLSAQGIRIALDDFGAGFCNFRYLKVLPLHYLKLDRSMIDGITQDKRDLAVLRAIVAMARALDLEVIAEGVESEEQRRRIAEEGCAFYQGFLRAAPMSAQAFEELAAGA